MIQSLTSGESLLRPPSPAHFGGTERAGEAEHDGDSDDGGTPSAAAMKPATMSNLPSFLGNRVNTLA